MSTGAATTPQLSAHRNRSGHSGCTNALPPKGLSVHTKRDLVLTRDNISAQRSSLRVCWQLESQARASHNEPACGTQCSFCAMCSKACPLVAVQLASPLLRCHSNMQLPCLQCCWHPADVRKECDSTRCRRHLSIPILETEQMARAVRATPPFA